MPFPLIIPEQLRTCLMAKEDVEAAVRKVFQEIQDKVEAQNNRRKVYLSEAMERLNGMRKATCSRTTTPTAMCSIPSTR